jgi:hypothetical protein
MKPDTTDQTSKRPSRTRSTGIQPCASAATSARRPNGASLKRRCVSASGVKRVVNEIVVTP